MRNSLTGTRLPHFCYRCSGSQKQSHSKIEKYFAFEGSGRPCLKTHLSHIFENKNCNELRVLLRKGPQKPEFACNAVHVPSSIIYADLIESDESGDAKNSSLRGVLKFES